MSGRALGGTLQIAWQAVVHYRARSVILALAVGLTFLLPVAVELLVTRYSEAMLARAGSTPLLVGAPGSRFDLVLNSLYFQGRVPQELAYGEVASVRESGRGTPIPLHVGIQVNVRGEDAPLVGTSLDYFGFRGLELAAGRLPGILGECVIGAGVAARTGLRPGSTVDTTATQLHDLAGAYPLRMHVVGVLAAKGTPDDGAVFADVKTAWVALGLGHGHGDAEELATEDVNVMRSGDGEVMLSPAVKQSQEITAENLESFHFHGDIDGFPITAFVVDPGTPKDQTLLLGDFRVKEARGGARMLKPKEVIEELLGFVLSLKRFFDANALLVTGAMGLVFGLIVLLTIRTRARELETLVRIGVSRGRVAALLGTEFGIVVCAGLVLAVAAALAVAAVLAGWIGG